MGKGDLVPQLTSLNEVYAGSDSQYADPEHVQRFQNLVSSFTERYHQRPDFVARSPGRVNIIGEHIDYSLYNVLPAAVAVDVLIAVRVAKTMDGPTVRVANVDSSKYGASELEVPRTGRCEIDKSNHEWSNYFKAGLNGALHFLRRKFKDSFSPRSMEILVDGNVPAGGGLSSSAAFVCASALAVMKANGHNVSKQDLLDLAIVSEREVGVYSGGMDQAASIFSERGYLLYCQFFPDFAEEHVRIPTAHPEITFLVAQSFITSDKAVTARKHYNLRVVEVTLAAVVLARLHSVILNPDESSLGFSLRSFHHELMKRDGRDRAPLEEQLDELIKVVKKSLIEDSYTREDIAVTLDISVETLEDDYFHKFPVQADAFRLRQRALHVYEEARRVLSFKNTLTDVEELDEKTLIYLGDLMNRTQDSCRNVYECSCPEIDDICSIARKAGTYGSRLTGAGWGGCTVHLVPQANVNAVIRALKTEYYTKHFPDITDEKLREALVISKPSQGSSLISGEALDGRKR